MNKEIKILPLEFQKAYRYVKDQLQDGHSLAKALLINLNFNEGAFFALLHPSADSTRIHEFRAGGILPANSLEGVCVEGKTYSGRRKEDSVHELAMYLKSILNPGQYCFFEDMVHDRSDPIPSDIEKYVLYFNQELYLYMSDLEFNEQIAQKIIHYSDAQWYYMNVISEASPSSKLNTTACQFQSIAFKTNLIVIGAYDMEGFVVWKRYSELAANK